MTLHVTCNGAPLESLRIHVPGTGPWFAELRFTDEAAEIPQGKVVIRVGAAELHGTIPASLDGSFALRRQATAFAGAGGWNKVLPAQSYHNDAGVKASLVAQDVARAAGETLGTFAPPTAKLGSHYLREAGPASATLEHVIGASPWWVGFDGVTQVAQRTATQPSDALYQVLNAWPDRNYLEIGLDDIRDVGVGATLLERLPTPQIVRSVEYIITPDKFRALCYCFPTAARSKLGDALAAIAKRSVDAPVYGVYRYRVGQMSGDRVDLQLVRKAAGLPDAMSVPIWPGAAGLRQRLAKGAEVLVQFIDGDRAQPAVTNFVGSGGPGFVPDSITIGGDDGSPAARQNDSVDVLLPPCIFNGTIGGVPASGVLTFPTMRTTGAISTGSGKVKIAT